MAACNQGMEGMGVTPEDADSGSSKKSYFPLLELPIEVVRLILKELLWSSAPLESDSNVPQAFSDALRQPKLRSGIEPAILQTCRHLNEEGSEILYSNTVSVRCDTHLDDDSMCEYPYIFWRRMMGRPLPELVRRRISRVRIHIYLEDAQRHTLEHLKSQLRSIARFVLAVPSWQRISVHMARNEAAPVDAGTWHSADQELLLSLQYLRGLKHVDIKGSKWAAAANLASNMMSTTTIPNLESIYTATQEYVHKTIKIADLYVDSFCSEAARHINSLLKGPLRASRESCNVVQFKRDRDRLMRLVTAVVLREQEGAVAYDPADWVIPHKLGPTDSRSWKPKLPAPEADDISALAVFERCFFHNNVPLKSAQDKAGKMGDNEDSEVSTRERQWIG